MSTLAAPERDRPQQGHSALEAVEVSKQFGGVHALRGVSLRLREGQIVGLIGPNGSGKTTLLNCVSGVFAPTSGSVLLDGNEIAGKPAHEIARAGVVRTFQNVRLFDGLTTLENVAVAALAAGGTRRRDSHTYARELLDRLRLTDLAERYAGTLSFGDQRRLEIARALAASPRFLLLDEPAAGMSEQESDELRKSIERVRGEQGCGVLVVEHDLRLIMRLCDSVQVLNEGAVISEGTPAQVRSDPAVIAAYIGEEEPRGKNGNEKGAGQ
jgi:branched-chain amino acid transport system permease protein